MNEKQIKSIINSVAMIVIMYLIGYIISFLCAMIGFYYGELTFYIIVLVIIVIYKLRVYGETKT